MADEAKKFSMFVRGRRREEAEEMGNCCAAPRSADFFKRTRNLRCISAIAGEEDDPEVCAVDLGFLVCVLGDGASGGEDLWRRYLLGEELGRGEFGVTRRCEDLETGEVLACKSISKRKLRTAVDVEDVRREVEIMRALPPHPQVVRFRDAFEDAEAVHIVMDLCDGGELFDRIVAEGCFGERAAAGFVRTIIEVVQHCHRHGVAHRDLKPENFLFVSTAEDSQLKAIDFGLSIFFEPGDRFNDIVGSPYYMAPEVLRKNYGPEADIWSAGVILYIMLCGYPPFWGDTDDEIARSIVRSAYSFEIEPWPSISEDAKDLVSCMLDPDPYTRLTADEVLDHPWIKNSSIDSKSAVNEFKQGTVGVGLVSLSSAFEKTLKLREGIDKIIGESISDSEASMMVETAMSYLDKNNRGGYIEVEELRDVLGERYQMVWNNITDAHEDKRMRISPEELKTRIMALSTKLNPNCKPSSFRCYSAEVMNSLTPRLFDDGCSHR